MHPILEDSPEAHYALAMDNMELVASNEDKNEKLLAYFGHDNDLSVVDSVQVEKEEDELSYDNDGDQKEFVESNECDFVEARDEMNDKNETTEQNAPFAHGCQKKNENDNMSETASSNQLGDDQPIVKRVDSIHVDVTFPLNCKPDQYFEIMHDEEMKRIKVPKGQEGKTVRIKLIRLNV